MSEGVIPGELYDLPNGKASLLGATTSIAKIPSGGTDKSADLFSVGGVLIELAPFASGAEADRLGCIPTTAALQQAAAKKKVRPTRAKLVMNRAPLFPACQSGFPDPISGDLRTVLRSNFCC
jgi:hypothetical protein